MRQPSDVTVLVVDDDPDITTFLGTILQDAGIGVAVAHDGDAALARIREAPPDLISLDLVMPGKSGIRFLHELRKHTEWSRIPVLIVTGHGRDEAVRRDLATVLSDSAISGPSLYLEKPVTPEKYLQAVCNTLKIELPTTAPAAEVELRPGLREEFERLLATASDEEIDDIMDILRSRTARRRGE